ncbi:MAG: hypothetical protein JWN03_6171, partial [Nocardia sp.]|nr:hypothetical protein [Nocardia sp.]
MNRDYRTHPPPATDIVETATGAIDSGHRWQDAGWEQGGVG